MTKSSTTKSLKTRIARGLAPLLALALVRLVSPAHAQTFNPDGATHDPTKPSGWALPAVNPATSNYNDCLRCHRPGGPSGAADAYLGCVSVRCKMCKL